MKHFKNLIYRFSVFTVIVVSPFSFGARLDFLIPAGPGGGLDSTARAMGDSLLKVNPSMKIRYENRTGGGGGKAMSYFVNSKASFQNTLLVNSTPLLIRSIQGVFKQTYEDVVRYNSFNHEGTSRFNSMGGAFGALGADLSAISKLATQYDALLMVDDSHAVGFMGKHGRGTPEYCGVEDKVDIYTNAELSAERANEYIDQGFDAIKFDPVGAYTPLDPRQLSLEELVKIEIFVKKIHDSVKNKCDLLIGTHGQMNTACAIRLAKRLEKFDPMWFEEPVPPENFEEMGRVSLSTSIPIATGERLTTKYEFSKILQSQGLRVFQSLASQVL